MNITKIGLIDVDGHNFPNLPLMKLAAWHKKQGDHVEWYSPMFSSDMDRVYMSKVFTFTPEYEYIVRADEIIKGGTGYLKNGGSLLPEEIEHTYPDYGMYNETRAIGFLSRGCPRGCDFCIVKGKEGLISKKHSPLKEFWNGQKYIEDMSPNLLACKEHMNILGDLIESGATVNFNQGVDSRLLNESNIELLKQVKISTIHFAWDNISDEHLIVPKLKMFKDLTGISDRKAIVYVLTNFNSTHEQDLYRVYKLRELGYSPYIMIYEKKTAPKITKQLARWVNNRFIWYKDPNGKFEDYVS